MDSYLDDLQREFVQQIFESHAAGTIDLQVAVQLAVVARFFERIGDHAVNIGEKVQYVASGWMPEHAGAMRFAAAEHGRRRRHRSRPDGWAALYFVVGIASILIGFALGVMRTRLRDA